MSNTMREILFRGKRKEHDFFGLGGEWVYGIPIRTHIGTFICFEENPHYCNQYGYMEIEEISKVIPETVGQFTSLTDKNGNKIFEGDIFRFSDEVWSSCYTSCGTEYDSLDVENYGVIGFDEENARFDFVRYKFGENSVEADLHENRNIEFAEFVSNLEIIGNIHDNSELLEESNEQRLDR